MFSNNRIFGMMVTLFAAIFSFLLLIRSWQTHTTWLSYVSFLFIIVFVLITGKIGWKLFREEKNHGSHH